MRKSTFVCIGLVGLLLLIPVSGAADVNFLLDLKPLSFLISPDADSFYVERGGVSGPPWSFIYEREEVDGQGSWIPSLKAGAGFEFPWGFLDVLGGVGYLWNDAFDSAMYIGDLGVRFKVDEGGVFTIGGHGGPIYFDPNWDGTSDLELDKTLGWMAGLCLTVGGEKAAFSASFDYVGAKLDVDTKNGWVASDSSLDISGFAVQLGVLFSF